MDSRETVAARLDELRSEMELRFTGEFIENAVNRLSAAANFLRQPTPDATIAALEEPTLELVKVADEAYERGKVKPSVERMKAALAAAAAHLRKA